MNESKQRRLKDIDELLDRNYSLLKKSEESKRVETHPRKIEELEKEIKRTRDDIKELEEERKPLEKAASEEKAKGGQWNVPFQRNPYFTGREQVFEKLHEALISGKIQVIKGLGGMGKTQTAVEYAFRYKKNSMQCSGQKPIPVRRSSPDLRYWRKNRFLIFPRRMKKTRIKLLRPCAAG